MYRYIHTLVVIHTAMVLEIDCTQSNGLLGNIKHLQFSFIRFN